LNLKCLFLDPSRVLTFEHDVVDLMQKFVQQRAAMTPNRCPQSSQKCHE
jgi:hypothetical protein